MEDYELRIIETLIAIGLCFVSLKIMQNIINRIGSKFAYHKTRVKIVRKIFLLIFSLIFVGVVLFIWGIKPGQLATYIASLLTVLGVAFFAQWSILSNITSTLIIFFNHEVHIGDTIQILDKEFQIEGKVYDVGMFFSIIKTAENEFISIPNNVFILKMVKKIKI